MKFEITRKTTINSTLTLITISSSAIISYLITDTLELILLLLVLFVVILFLNSLIDFKSYKNAKELRDYIEKLLYLIFGDKFHEKYRCHIYFIDSETNRLVPKEELTWNFAPDAHIE